MKKYILIIVFSCVSNNSYAMHLTDLIHSVRYLIHYFDDQQKELPNNRPCALDEYVSPQEASINVIMEDQQEIEEDMHPLLRALDDMTTIDEDRFLFCCSCMNVGALLGSVGSMIAATSLSKCLIVTAGCGGGAAGVLCGCLFCKVLALKKGPSPFFKT
jgi:hypothetical protein